MKAKYFVSKDYFVEGLQKSTRWYINVFIVTETMFIISYVYLLRLSIPRKRKKLMKGYRKKKDALWHWRVKKKIVLKLAEKKREFRNRGAAHANSLVLIVLSCYICYIRGFAIHTECVLNAWNLPQGDFELTTCPRTMTTFLLIYSDYSQLSRIQ